MGKGNHKELCKKLKFDHTYKWHVHQLESVIENEMRMILWDLEIQTDDHISARRANQEYSFFSNCFFFFKVKVKWKLDKYLDLARGLMRLLNMKVTVISVVETLGTDHKNQEKNWFGLVLWHINHYWLLNAKSFSFLYIQCMILNMFSR